MSFVRFNGLRNTEMKALLCGSNEIMPTPQRMQPSVISWRSREGGIVRRKSIRVSGSGEHRRVNTMKKIKELRNKAGMKQSELAEKIGVSMYTVSCWERGIRKPEIGSIRKICDFFDIGLSEFFADEKVVSNIREEDIVTEKMTGDFIEANELLCLREAFMEVCGMVCMLSGSGDRYTLASEMMTKYALKFMREVERDEGKRG